MNSTIRFSPGRVFCGWVMLLAVVALAVRFAGPNPAKIAALNVTNGMTLTFGSIYLTSISIAALLTLLVVQAALRGIDSLFEFHPASNDLRQPIANWFRRVFTLSVYALVSLLSCYFLFVRLGKTLMCVIVPDTFIFYEGAERLAHGQVPHVDYHTPMGFFCSVLPYWGLKAAGGLAGSMEWCGLFAGCLLLALAVPMLASRLTAATAVPLVIYFCLLAVVPLDLEDAPQRVTHAMFFNRLGWIAVSLVFLFFLQPRFQSKFVLAADAVCLGALLFFMLYLKINFFVVGLGFLPLLFISSRYGLKLSLLAFGVLVAGIVIVELSYGLNGPYGRDLLMAVHASGANRKSMPIKFIANIKEFSLVAIAVALTWQRNDLRPMYLLFVGYVTAAGLLIIDQNTQANGVICLLSALAVTQELERRRIVANENESGQYTSLNSLHRLKSLACLGLMLVLIIQPVLYRFMTMAMIRSAVTQVEPDLPQGLSGMVFVDHLWNHFCAGKTRDENTNKVVPPALRAEGQVGYLDVLLDGMKMLNAAGTSGKHVMVFDFVTPFSSLLDMTPPPGGHTAIDFARTMSDRDFAPPEELLGAVDYVMVPRKSEVSPTTQFLLRTYGDYLKSNYDKSSESDHWTLWTRHGTAPEAAKDSP